MKAKFLKIAGVKNESQFYKKYPTEEAFFKAHPEAKKMVKKAQVGSYIGGDVDKVAPMKSFKDYYDQMDLGLTGMTDDVRLDQQAKMKQLQASQQSGGGGGLDMGSIMKIADMAGAVAKSGKKIKKAQTGTIENFCGVGFVYDQASQQCIPDFSMPIQGGQSSAASSVPTGEYEEVQKINYNRNLSGGTPKTGPGTGVNPAAATAKSSMLDKLGGPQGIAQTAGGLIEGFQALAAQKRALKAAQQSKAVSDVALMASATRPEQEERRYVRPEDSLVSPNQIYRSYGTGTNPIAEDGALLNRVTEGVPGEIQNIYNMPNTLYSDLGYEPLSESDRLKQFADGGFMTGLKSFAGQGGGDILTSLIDQSRGYPSAGAQIGKSAGKAIGTVVGGPLGGMIGGTLGNIAGGLLDPNAKRIERLQKQTQRNVEKMALQQGIGGLTGQYSAFVRDGGIIPNGEYGWVSHDWQPQVITHFGEHRVSDLLKEDETMDTLRTGGNLRQNYMFPKDMMALGGEIQTTWGGYAEPISQNPYLPGTGETIMFRGNSHDESDGKGRTGIGVKYGNDGEYTPYMEYGKDGVEDVTDVEVERNEPAAELVDENGEKNLVVYGNLHIPNYALSAIGDPDAKGKKFKSYVSKLSEKEEKQNKIIEKTSNELADFQPITAMDKLKWETLTTTLQGANTKLAQYATFKQNAAAVQNAINDTAKEHGLSAEHLAKGITKFQAPNESQAKHGKKIKMAQKGVTYPVYGPQGEVMYNIDESGNRVDEVAATATPVVSQEVVDKKTSEKPSKTYSLGEIPKGQRKGKIYYGKVTDTNFNELIKNNPWYDWKNFNPARKGDVRKFQKEFNKMSEMVGSSARLTEDDKLGEQTASARVEYPGAATVAPGQPTTTGSTPTADQAAKTPPAIQEKKKPKVMDYVKALSTYVPRRPYQEGLDYAQLYPEMFAMATNQLEPVQAQLYRPQLKTPYDISLQDMMNQNQADFNAMQRMTGYNPAAAASLAAQKYAANEKVLGEQFRQNQAMRMGIANENINTLNDAQLKNLQILDNQYVRQAQARSNTKATTFSALSSIADKVAKNKLENRTFAAYSNMFPQYGFRGDMSMFSQAPTFFNVPEVGGAKPVYDKKGNLIGYKADQDIPSLATQPISGSSASTSEAQSTGKRGAKLKKTDLKNSMFIKPLKRI